MYCVALCSTVLHCIVLGLFEISWSFEMIMHLSNLNRQFNSASYANLSESQCKPTKNVHSAKKYYFDRISLPNKDSEILFIKLLKVRMIFGIAWSYVLSTVVLCTWNCYSVQLKLIKFDSNDYCLADSLSLHDNCDDDLDNDKHELREQSQTYVEWEWKKIVESQFFTKIAATFLNYR